MPSIKLDLSDELAEKIERDTIDNGSSRQKVIQHIIAEHYSLATTESEPELDYLRRENKILYEHLELLRGVSAMIMAKQLISTEEVVEPSEKPRWMTRIKHFLGFKV